MATKKRKRGRPREKMPLDRYLVLRFDKAQYDALKETAANETIPMAALVRMVMWRYCTGKLSRI